MASLDERTTSVGIASAISVVDANIIDADEHVTSLLEDLTTTSVAEKPHLVSDLDYWCKEVSQLREEKLLLQERASWLLEEELEHSAVQSRKSGMAQAIEKRISNTVFALPS
jgi:hypothetical protein